jgi:hypothetical protein
MTLMVCIATNQEVTNLIPALEYQAREVVTFATRYAAAQRWPQRLADALRTRPVRVVELTDEHEYAPNRLAALILHHIRHHRADAEPVCFAWAGGQKPQSVGMWLAFEALCQREPRSGHIAAYMEQTQGKLLEWPRPQDNARQRDITHPIGIDELLACYGQVVSPGEGAGTPLWPHPTSLSWIKSTYNIYQNNKYYLALCFQYHTALLQGHNVSLPGDKSVLEYLNKVNNSQLARTLSPNLFKLSPHTPKNKNQEFPTLFELLVQYRTTAWLERRADYIGESRANVIFESLKPDEPTGELDVAILTRAGKLIALDAKISAKSASIMRRAQESSVRQSGGDFAKRAIVIPAHSADIAQAPAWFPAENVSLIHRWRQNPRAVAPLVPFDDHDAFERALDALCNVKPTP